MKFEYWKTPAGQWAWHLKAANGEIIAQGEGYEMKRGALHAIRLIQNSSDAPIKQFSNKTSKRKR